MDLVRTLRRLPFDQGAYLELTGSPALVGEAGFTTLERRGGQVPLVRPVERRRPRAHAAQVPDGHDVPVALIGFLLQGRQVGPRRRGQDGKQDEDRHGVAAV